MYRLCRSKDKATFLKTRAKNITKILMQNEKCMSYVYKLGFVPCTFLRWNPICLGVLNSFLLFKLVLHYKLEKSSYNLDKMENHF